MKSKLLTLLLIGAFISCNQAPEAAIEVTESNQAAESDSTIELGEVVSFNQIKTQVLEPLNCTMCHGDMAQEAAFKSYLEAGEPFSSKIYLRMENETMPPRGNTATKKQLELLESYIRDLQASVNLGKLEKKAAVKCEYEEGSCMYYIKCRRQWPPTGCS